MVLGATVLGATVLGATVLGATRAVVNRVSMIPAVMTIHFLERIKTQGELTSK